MCTETAEKSGPPQLVTSDKAFRWAELWLKNMSKSDEDDEPVKIETVSRSLRLGLGATVPCRTRPVIFNDPVARKLSYNMEARKKKAAEEIEESSVGVRDTVKDVDSDDEESRTKAFTKKRAPPPNPVASLSATKKRK